VLFKGETYNIGSFVRIERDVTDDTNFETSPEDLELSSLCEDKKYQADRVMPKSIIFF
jgi:hypothetical protein